MCFEILLVLILFQFKKEFRNSGCKSKIVKFYNKKKK